jgi:transposase InsO family protein
MPGPSSSSARPTTRRLATPQGSPAGSRATSSGPAGGSSASWATTATSYRSQAFKDTLASLGASLTHIRSGRPQTNGHVEALHRLILEECWRPAFARYLYPRYTGLGRELEHYLAEYNFDRVHHGRLTRGRIPADIVYGARKMEAR